MKYIIKILKMFPKVNYFGEFDLYCCVKKQKL